MLIRGHTLQAALRMQGVDGVLQALQFAFQGSQARVASLQQAGLKPTVEMFDAALTLRLSGRDQNRLDTETQTDPQNPRKITGGRTPADYFACVVELHLGWQAEGLPALAQEVEHDLRLAGAVDFQAHGTIEGVLADEDVVALPVAFQVDRANAVHLMQLIRFVGLRHRIGRIGHEGREPNLGHTDAIALQDAFDRAGWATVERAKPAIRLKWHWP